MLPLTVFAALVSAGVAVEEDVGIEVVVPGMVMTPEVNGTSLTRVADGKAADCVSPAEFGVSLVLLGFKTLKTPTSTQQEH